MHADSSLRVPGNSAGAAHPAQPGAGVLQINRRRNLNRFLAATVLVCVGYVVVILVTASLRLVTDEISRRILLVAVLTPLLAALAYTIARCGPVEVAATAFLSCLIGVMAFADPPAAGLEGRTLIAMTLPIAVAVFLLPAWTGFLFAGLATLAALLLAPQEPVTFYTAATIYLSIAVLQWKFGGDLQRANDQLRTMNQTLQQFNADLEHGVEERTAELTATNAALQRASRVKDEFLATMSHELRTPLMGILSSAEAMSLQFYGPLTPRQERSVEIIAESGQHLLTLINGILDLAKIEAGKLELVPQRFAVNEVCLSALHLVQPQATARRQQVGYRCTPTTLLIYADPQRVKQMLVNLLGNAVKFTPDGGSICLEVVADLANRHVQFTVEDNGIGIAPEDMSSLFEPFQQVQSGLTRKYGGSGLGLVLVKRLAEQHSGAVGVSSEPGAGSRFYFTLPWEPDPDGSHHGSHQGSDSSTRA